MRIKKPEPVAADHEDTESTNQDLVKEALRKVAAAWQKTTEERQHMLGEFNLPKVIEDADMDEYDEEYDQPLTESENFVVYSNVEFLLLIGKFCAHSSQLAD